MSQGCMRITREKYKLQSSGQTQDTYHAIMVCRDVPSATMYCSKKTKTKQGAKQ